MNRIVLRKIHAIAGAAAFLLIATFWTSTVISELFGSQATVVAVKHIIVYALFALMFCMALAGATGMKMGVSITPWSVVMRPARALDRLSVWITSKFMAAKVRCGEQSGGGGVCVNV